MKIEEIQSGDRGKPRDGATSTCHLTETPVGGQLAQCADVIWCLAQSLLGPSGACRGLECIHRLTLAFELCVRGQPLVGLEPLSVSVCVFFYVCQWGGRQMVKFTHHISCPCGSTDSRRTEGDRAEEQGSGFSPLSSFPSLPSSHPVYAPLTPSLLPSLPYPSPGSIERLLSQWKRKWKGGCPLATLTQLVRLIK